MMRTPRFFHTLAEESFRGKPPLPETTQNDVYQLQRILHAPAGVFALDQFVSKLHSEFFSALAASFKNFCEELCGQEAKVLLYLSASPASESELTASALHKLNARSFS